MVAVVNMDLRGITPDELRVIGLGVRTTVGKVEARLCAVNKANASGPMDFALLTPDVVGPRIEALSAIDRAQPSEGIQLEAAG